MIKSIFGLLLSMLGTVVFCAVFILIFANSTNMTCQRQSDGSFKCLIQKQLFGKITTSTRVIDGVTGARTAESCDSDGCSYRTELTTANGGSAPYDEVYTDHASTVENTNRIKGLLKPGGSARFTIDSPVQLWVLFLIGGLGLMGLVMEAIAIFAQIFKGVSGRR